MVVKYVKRNKIDDTKWDNCVKNSVKPLIYGISWYLDAATNRKWDGIIVGDYEAVLPLPWNRKMICKQVFTPHPIQQLGPFITSKLDFYELEELQALIHSKFLSITIGLSTPMPSAIQKLNLILDLHKSYDQLYKLFRKDRKRDEKNDQLRVEEYSNQEHFLSFFKNSSDQQFDSTYDFSSFQRVVAASLHHKKGKIYVARWNQELVSAIFVTKFDNRITLLISSTNDRGYKLRANTYLVAHLIKQFANKPYILDFEGSEIPGVKDFYESFGAQAEYYYFYTKQNKWVRKVKAILGK